MADTTTARAWITGTSEDPIINFDIPAGPKGEPGGWTTGTLIGKDHLDTITTPGLYKQTEGSSATEVNGYPANSRVGVLSVISRIPADNSYGPSVVQEYTPFFGQPNWEGRIVFKRILTGKVWQPWRAYVAQRVDNTAGRAIYTWDDTVNREQLIYGDTGWRDVTTYLLSDFSCTSIITRRDRNMVTVCFDGVKSATATGHVGFMSTAVGFRPDMANGTGNQRYNTATDLSGQNGRIISPENTSYNIRFLSYTTGLALHGSFTYYTRDPWPTELPGTAIGSIPNV